MIAQYKYYFFKDGERYEVTTTYSDGMLRSVEGTHIVAWTYLLHFVQPIEQDIKVEIQKEGFAFLVHTEEIEVPKINQKIALFCKYYKHYQNVAYKVKKRTDAAKLSDVPATQSLMKLYFTNKEWWGKQPKSITNYCNNINALLALEVNGNEIKRKYPVEWSLAVERKLKPEQIQEWWKQLRNDGYTPVKHNGKTIKWAKAQ